MPTTPAIVQTASYYNAASVASIGPATFTNPATTGNGILVLIAWHTTGVDITSVTDANSANLYGDQQDVTGNGDNVSIYWLPAIQAGSGTISITVALSAVATFRWINAFEISGAYFIPDPGMLGQNQYPTGSPTSAPQIPGLILNLASELIFTALFPEGSPTNTPTSGWTSGATASPRGEQSFYTSGVAPTQSYTAAPCTLSAANAVLIASIGLVAAGTWPAPSILPSRSYRNGRTVPGGVYYLRGNNDTPGALQTSPGWTAPGCNGHALRQTWAGTETANGVYNFAYYDLAFSLSNTYKKKVGFSTAVGPAGLPSWLTGYASLAFSTGTIAAPWDPVYQAALQTFIQALGARYANQPLLSYVIIRGLGGSSSDTGLFATTTADDTLFFNAFGGSQAAAVAGYISAAMTIIGYWAAAFPQVPICFDIGHTLSTSIPGAANSAFAPFYAITQLASNKYGMSIKNVNLNPDQSIFPAQVPPLAYFSTLGLPICGWQEVNPPPTTLVQLVEDLQFADATGAYVYEAYPTDFTNFAWAGVLEQFNLKFSLMRPPPTEFGIGSI